MTLAFAEIPAARHSQVFPSSASDGSCFSRLHRFAICCGLPSCLSPWRIWPGIPPSRQGLLLPSFPRVGHPFRGRV